MARIAVDARPLSIPTTGIGRYTGALLQRMIESDHQWFLYSDRPLRVDFGRCANVRVRSGNLPIGKLSSFYAQARFPVWAKQDRVELFWSPRHHLPLVLDRSIARVVTIHDLVWKRFPDTMSKLGRVLESLLMPPSIRSADAVIAVSQSTRNEIAELYSGVANRLHTVLEAPFLPVSTELPVRGDFFLFVGTLEPRKNLPGLLRAYSSYVHKDPAPLPLKICGGRGWGLPELQSLLAELQLVPYVELLGYVPDGDLPELYRQARALLIPSLYEGFGLPIVEAFSQGTPVLTSNHGAMAEVAGDAGLLVDSESEAEIAGALERLGQDLELVFELQQKSLSRVQAFSWDLAATQTLTILESVSVRAER